MVMEMKYQFNAEQYTEIIAAKKANRDKQIDARLNVLLLRCEGKSLVEIARDINRVEQTQQALNQQKEKEQ